MSLQITGGQIVRICIDGTVKMNMPFPAILDGSLTKNGKNVAAGGVYRKLNVSAMPV